MAKSKKVKLELTIEKKKSCAERINRSFSILNHSNTKVGRMRKRIWQSHVDSLHRFMLTSSLLNSSNLSKSVLILILGANDFIKWFLWIYFSNANVQNQQWINQEYYLAFLRYNIAGFFLFWGMVWICIRLKDSAIIQKYMPYIAVITRCSIYMFNGYCVGIGSPATIAAYVNLICLGLVLFTRDIVYSALIPMTIALLALIFLSTYQLIPYAPLFSDALNQSILIYNTFWVYSMLIIYIPIFFASVVIFEILLLQWRNRENLVNEISQKDPLTGVFNRRVIDRDLEKLHQLNSSYAVVLIDLDHFKSINDRFGHDVGDHVLRRVAKVLDANIRGNDMVGRFGGEEFLMILQTSYLDQIIEIAERCRKQIEQEHFVINDNLSIQITASFGISIYQNGMTHEQVIKRADQALYVAKEQGRNQIQCAI